MGVRDTNVALFSIVLLLLLGLALNFSVIMSRQAAQITRLAQERALEKAPRAGELSARTGPLEPEEERLERQLLGDVEVEAAAGVLDQLGGAAGACRVEPRGLDSRARSRRSRLKTTSVGAGGGRGEVAEPGGAELEAEVEDLGAAAAAGPFGLVGDVAGGAFDPGLLLLLERLAGRRLGLLAGRPRPSSAAPPGRRRDLARERRRGAALGLGPQLAARGREQQAGQLEVAGGEAGGGGDLVRLGRRRPSSASTASAGSGAKSTGWQREAIVSSSAAGSELSRIRWTNSGGSSSVFSSAFWLSSRIASAASTTKTRLPPSKGR